MRDLVTEFRARRPTLPQSALLLRAPPSALLENLAERLVVRLGDAFLLVRPQLGQVGSVAGACLERDFLAGLSPEQRMVSLICLQRQSKVHEWHVDEDVLGVLNERVVYAYERDLGVEVHSHHVRQSIVAFVVHGLACHAHDCAQRPGLLDGYALWPSISARVFANADTWTRPEHDDLIGGDAAIAVRVVCEPLDKRAALDANPRAQQTVAQCDRVGRPFQAQRALDRLLTCALAGRADFELVLALAGVREKRHEERAHAVVMRPPSGQRLDLNGDLSPVRRAERNRHGVAGQQAYWHGHADAHWVEHRTGFWRTTPCESDLRDVRCNRGEVGNAQNNECLRQPGWQGTHHTNASMRSCVTPRGRFRELRRSR